jgi:site-specific recombinase XerD
MAYLRKTDVLAAIKTRTQCIHGVNYTIYEAYLGISPLTKKPIRKAANSIEKLRKAINDFYQRLSSGGDASTLLNPYQSIDARNALDMLAKAKSSMTLTECVRRVLESEDALKPCTTTLGEAFRRYYTQQEKDGKSAGHLKSLRHRTGAWVERFGGERMVSEVTAKEIAEYLEKTFLKTGAEKEKTTYNGRLDYIKTFVKWCAAPEQGYIKENPAAAMKPKMQGHRDPEYMRPAAVEKLFRALEKRGGADLACAILSFFCGMRQEEIMRAPEGDSAIVIDLEEKYIRVVKCKGSTRGIRPRAFTIPEQALAWMRSMPDFAAAVRTPNWNFRDHLVEAGNEAGVRVPENAGRHTFCTMFDAAHHDDNALSAIAGNTPSIRDKHYNGVAKPQDGRDYFAIMPAVSQVRP